MREKKVVGRNVAIALGVITIILAVGLVGAIANYASILNNKDSTIQSKDSQIQTLTSQKNQLQTWLDGNNSLLIQTQAWLEGNLSLVNSLNSQITSKNSQISSLNSQINSLNAQITNLQNQIDALEVPKLIKVKLLASDDRPWLQTPRLHVYGCVCNVGTNIAYNSKLHVVAYQSGGVVAIDTYITLGSIYGESWTNVDTNVFYSGDALTSWSITPEWTS